MAVPDKRMAVVNVGYEFGRNLRAARKRADLSQEEVGLRSTLHRTEIGLLERGGRTPRIDTLIKLATALDISPCDLLEGITWSTGSTNAGGFTFRGADEEDAG